MIRGFGNPKIWACVALVLLFVASPTVFGQDHSDRGWLLPESISDEGDAIDNMFWLIFWLTGAVFLASEGALVYFIVKYRAKEGGKALYTHGNHKVEVIWTVIPAVILLGLGVAQVDMWVTAKDPGVAPIDDADAFEVHVLAKQFEWWFRYRGPDNKWNTDDDFVASRLVVPKGRPVIIRLRSIDVIHSLFLPELRFKQDAVPGLTMTGWFRARKAGQWEIACAELCGASHYKMRGEYEIVEPADWSARYAKMLDDAGPVDYDNPTEFFRFWPIEEVATEDG